jgi:aminoglycoside phosphotransferase (APT) family kinase protein
MDEADLTRRVGAALQAEVDPVERVTSGTSSLVYSTTIRGSGQEVIVKSGVPGLEPVRNRDMLRQARLHRALKETAVPVPEVLAEEAGAPPEVAPFYVMDKVPGDCVEVAMLPDGTFSPQVIRGRQLDTARIMGELHNVDPRAVGLGDEPEIPLADEVQRWKHALDACDEDLRANTDDIYERLMNTVPAPIPSRLLHGDFRTGNALAVEDHLTAIIDWEIWSRSDPRIDLAWFLIFVELPRGTAPSGMPSVDELIDTYGAVSGVEVKDFDWFRALVRYKQTAAGAFITRNARRRGAPVEPVDNTTAPLLVSARSLLGL